MIVYWLQAPNDKNGNHKLNIKPQLRNRKMLGVVLVKDLLQWI
jgi:hypothetical protein